MKKTTALFFATLATMVSIAQMPSFHVTTEGSGAPVLFLPGFATPASVWQGTVRQLQGGKQSHLVTYAGFGGVPPIDTPWYPSLKRDLIRYITEKNLSGLVIIGHSMGGTLAVDIAAALPGKVERLVLVDALPAMRDLMMPGVPAAKIAYNTPYNNTVLQLKEDAFRQMAVSMAGGMTAIPASADTITKWILATDRNTYVYGFTDLLKLDLRDDLSRITAKTLVLGAPFPTKEVAGATFEKQYANLKNKQIAMAPGGRHFIMFDEPAWFYQQVNEFLK